MHVDILSFKSFVANYRYIQQKYSLAHSTKRIMLLEVSYPKLYMDKSCIRTIYVCINTMYCATKFPVSLEFIHFFL